MFDDLDDGAFGIALMVYGFGVVFHGVLMALRGAVGSDGQTLMEVAQSANDIARLLYLIPGLCYAVAALICLFSSGWKAMVVMTILIVAAMPLLVFIMQYGVWVLIAVIVAMVLMAVLAAFAPAFAIGFFVAAPVFLVILFVMIVLGLVEVLSTSAGF